MIEILMATYNGEKYIGEQIESVIAQSYTDWHMTICDDCSKDGTLKIAKAYAARYPDKIYAYKNETNSGSAAKNFFSMLLASKGAEYVMFCDQDDVWEQNKIKYTYLAMQDMEKKYGKNIPLLVHTDLRVVDERLKTISNSMIHTQKLQGSNRSFAAQLTQNCITGCTMMVNRGLTRLIKAEPENMIMHDWWLGILASAFGHIGFVNMPLINYRQHGNNTEGAKDFTGISNTLSRASKSLEIKNSIRLTYLQAEDFKKYYYGKLDEDNKAVLYNYIEMQKKSKPAKLWTVFCYGYKKTGLNRMLGYLLYL
jgi:glycosyltransferase involved in cell wall biosynthesis